MRLVRSLVLAGFVSVALVACSSGSDNNNANDTNQGAQVPVACANMTMPSGKVAEYCIKRPAGVANPINILYVFHGLGGSAREIYEPYWEDLETLIGSGLAQAEEFPIIVSISYGPTAIIASSSAGNAAPDPQELIDFGFANIEQGLMINAPTRHILGTSLGGFNALSVLGVRPSSIESAALLCPAIINFNPFVQSEVDSFVQRNASILDMNKVSQAVGLVRYRIGSSADWVAAEPLGKLNNGDYDNAVIGLTAQTEDEYGFYEGTAVFQTTAQARGIDLTWVPSSGRHCQGDIQGLGPFFARAYAE